jgi:hypothetical protein
VFPKQAIAGAEAYIARADRRIQKHRGVIDRSHNEQTVATAQDLVDVLIKLRANVEYHQRRLRERAASRARADLS